MIIRYAEFVGAIREGKEFEFFRFVQEVLTPLWTKFDGAESVTVSREVERDEGAPSMPLLLAIAYSDKGALERAMACDARFESREQTKTLLEMFDGVVYHRVTDRIVHRALGN
ncbi:MULTISPECIES: hypothetical protein [unclassified Rhizobium]|uniref:hypothetical protein n=1 Tax=unclassified Rhizobium TaxID=2613769 RepID=UPI0016084093|nr:MULTISPECIES: hypothetical protein [unclassified Rhizobium]MBB3317440.1 hypothetical protein [Rhizobium sp. BK181]MBB3543181.1 hypothetical protein [Rhizobium sp. BK399]MCS3744206.1 hypothetical protein [Rhizobium sp. BK661]MCS4096505.1 hypothetical protein [Rhizobium sp. BK176]